MDADIGRIHAISGNRKEAERAIVKLKKESTRRYVNPYQIALIQVGLGQEGEAFAWLDKALHERSDLLVYPKIDSRLDPLRSHPHFAELESKVRIPR